VTAAPPARQEPGPPSRERMRLLCDAAAADLVRWRAGESEALERLVRAVTPTLWHVVRAYGLERASAEDVVQTTWLTLVKHRDGIGDPQAVVRWLTVTARREAWRVARAAGRTQQTDDTVLDLRSSSQDGPEAVAVRRRRDEALWRAVAALPERCRRLLRVVAFSERVDYGRLSEDLGMPVGSIGPTRGRCLAKLRSELSRSGDWRTA
jgi:RNA polymerase sigma factor (sigma-70 family)